MVTATDTSYMLTPAEAAAFLNVSRSTVYRYIREEKLIPARCGRTLRISRGQLEWLKNPASHWIKLRDYTDEQIAQFLRDDVLTPEQEAIVERIRALSDRC